MLYNENGLPIQDTWNETNTELDRNAPDDVSGNLIVPWNIWDTHRQAFVARHDAGIRKIGLLFGTDDSFEELCSDLSYFDLIEFNFEKFSDGRPFSHAALLRNRYDFRGELRASGAIHRDQLAQLRRVGFNTFSLENNPVLESKQLPTNAFREVYQGAADNIRTVREQRRT